MFADDKRVKALVEIQSDDRAAGMDDGTPILPAGTEGTIIGKSEEFTPENLLKVDDCWLVDFDGHEFDVSETEMELV